jgi:glycosyltransferase involved in cell wall biosynthesis
VRLLCLFPGENRAGAERLPDWGCLAPGGALPGITVKLRREVRRYRPDIILSHGGVPFRYAVLARGVQERPLIVYRKIGLSGPWLRSWRLPRLALQRWLQRRADWICCVAEDTRREVTGLFRIPAERVSVIYGGVDEQPFAASPAREQARSALGIAAHGAVLMGIGELGWEKHQEAMLRVLAAFRGSGTSAVLLLVGEGPERGRLERLAADLGCAGAVRFLGTRTDVPTLLAASDVVLLTSLTEGLPGVLVEAGMAGVAAVAWDVAGVREVVRDGITGLVPPYRDEQAFAAAVQRVLGDPAAAARMGAAAREFCRERFSMKRCVAEHLQLFRDLLGARG